MRGRFARLSRRMRVLIALAMGTIGTVALGIGAVFVAEAHPETLLTLMGARSSRVLVIAHRGASDEAPENTLAAFDRARDLGADGVECDVVFTRDDVPVIIHDDDLGTHQMKRPGVKIADLNLDEVKRIDVGSWFSPRFADERIPTLREGLDSLAVWAKRVYLHDKETNDYAGPKRDRIRAFADQIRGSGMRDRAVVMVAGENEALWRELAPDIHVLKCWLMESNQEKVRTLQGYGSPETTYLGTHAVFLHSYNWAGRRLLGNGFPHLGQIIGLWPTRADVALYKAKPCDFVVFTINDPFRMLLYSYKRFDAVGTDKPALMLSVLRRPPGRAGSR